MNKRNLKTKEGAITLIALIITIIVLLILAGVTIKIIINNGLIDKAQSSVDKWDEVSKEENNQMDDFVKKYDNTVENLGQGGEKVEPTLASKAEPGDYVKYIVPDKAFSISTADSGYNTVQSFNPINYTGTWQVLYNDAEHGLQIVSTDDVTGGSGLYFGTQLNEGACKTSYQKGVETLNNFCSNYTNESYALSARCVGSHPVTQIPTTDTYKNPSVSYVGQYASDMLNEDDNYVHDYEAMKNAKKRNPEGIHNTTSIWYWLASRKVNIETSQGGFAAFCIMCGSTENGGEPSPGLLYAVLSNGQKGTNSQRKAVRPVVKLIPTVETIVGDGSAEAPFELIAKE